MKRPRRGVGFEYVSLEGTAIRRLQAARARESAATPRGVSTDEEEASIVALHRSSSRPNAFTLAPHCAWRLGKRENGRRRRGGRTTAAAMAEPEAAVIHTWHVYTWPRLEVQKNALVDTDALPDPVAEHEACVEDRDLGCRPPREREAARDAVAQANEHVGVPLVRRVAVRAHRRWRRRRDRGRGCRSWRSGFCDSAHAQAIARRSMEEAASAAGS